MGEPKILLYDLETAPALGYVWGKWEQNVIEFQQNGYILSFAYKWLGKEKVHTVALPDFRASSKIKDEFLALSLHVLFDEADVVIAHNGDNFDAKTANARFLANELLPPSPYKSVDTLKLARKHFRFPSNKLDDLGQYLGIGRKLPTKGKDTWLGCMEGDDKAWKIMKKYNAQDVVLLEKVYLRLRSWATTHPNLDSYKKNGSCPVCQSDKIQRRGWNVTKTGRRERIHCQDCGAWSSGTKHIRDEAN